MINGDQLEDLVARNLPVIRPTRIDTFDLGSYCRESEMEDEDGPHGMYVTGSRLVIHLHDVHFLVWDTAAEMTPRYVTLAEDENWVGNVAVNEHGIFVSYQNELGVDHFDFDGAYLGEVASSVDALELLAAGDYLHIVSNETCASGTTRELDTYSIGATGSSYVRTHNISTLNEDDFVAASCNADVLWIVCRDLADESVIVERYDLGASPNKHCGPDETLTASDEVSAIGVGPNDRPWVDTDEEVYRYSVAGDEECLSFHCYITLDSPIAVSGDRAHIAHGKRHLVVGSDLSQVFDYPATGYITDHAVIGNDLYHLVERNLVKYSVEEFRLQRA